MNNLKSSSSGSPRKGKDKLAEYAASLEARLNLQELLDPPQHISQAELCEYLRARLALDSAREEVENLGSLIVEKLILRQPLQPGPLVASLGLEGKLEVVEVLS